jgi:integrase
MGVTVREKIKGSGQWWVFLNHNGVRKSKLVGGKVAALSVKRELEKQIAEGSFKLEKKEMPTFGEYASRWIATTVPVTCKTSTLENYQNKLNKHILPFFDKLPITEVNRMKVKEFLMEKANQGLSNSVLGNFKTIISGALSLAIDDGSLTSNPSYRLGKSFRSKKEPLIVEPLTTEDLALLLKTFKTHYPAYYPIALTLARTGMRIGEVLGLQWKDIDFRSGLINVNRSFSRGKVGTPKGGKGRRVEMSNQLTETLQSLLRERKADKLSNGWKELPEWVFINSKKEPVCDSHFRDRVFEKVLVKAGLRKIKVHTLRHTYASLLVQNGESLVFVKEQMGHDSIKTTIDIYSHLAPRGNHDAVNRLDDAPICTLSAPKR